MIIIINNKLKFTKKLNKRETRIKIIFLCFKNIFNNKDPSSWIKAFDEFFL
jgi:hypothetical protein